LPATGVISQVQAIDGNTAPLELITRGAANYFIKVEREGTREVVATAFIRGGERIELAVPFGLYILKFATGESWYGTRFLFGPSTQFGQADPELLFRESGQYVEGHTIELFLQPNGNLNLRTLDAEQF